MSARNTVFGREPLIALGAVLVAVSATALFMFSERIFGNPIDRGRTAYARGDLEQAIALADRWLTAHPDDLEAVQLKARSLTRLDRGSEAYPLFERLGGECLTAGDVALVGNALLKAKREVLGLTALNAASRLDAEKPEPGAAETVAKLLSARNDSPRTIKESERLAAIPSAAALAEIVVAIAAADDPSRSNAKPPPDLTRLLRLDRQQIIAIDSIAAVRKRMARMRLEDGQIPEARSWLQRIPDTKDSELQWLLSRVALAEKDLSSASSAMAEAHGFGSDDLTRLEPAPYVGAKRCSTCHAEIFTSHQKTGHAETFTTGPAMQGVPLPRGSVQDPGNPEVSHTFSRSDRGLELESDVKGKVLRVVLDYALGSGRHGMTMLGREPSGNHRMLRLSYYSTGGEHWDLTSGLEKRPEGAEDYIGSPVGEESLVRCLNCHTTRFTSEHERNGPEAADRGIGCERCHGPAGYHLTAVELEFSDPAIGRPKSATPAQRLKLCGQCHGSDGIIPPSDPRFIRFQAANLPFSRCVTESGGKLDCIACHDPHRALETDQRYYEVRCLACHNGSKSSPAKLPAGVRIDPVASKPCPVNAKTGCVSCHMPKAKEVMPHTDFTDHHIRNHRNSGGTRTAGAIH